MIRCPDGSEVTMDRATSEEPGSCSVTENEDGSATILCTDGTSATVSKGDDGSDGEAGTKASWIEGTSCIALRDTDRLEVSCLGGQSVSLAPDCSIERQRYRNLDWATYSCPDAETGIITVQRENPALGKAQLIAGLHHTCLLSEIGELRCWGSETHPQTSDIPDEPFVAVAMDYYHSCALRPDLSTTCWGSNSEGQTEAPPTERFVDIGVGLHHSCGLREDGSTLCWGYFESGSPINDPLAGTYVQIAVGEHNVCGLRADGSVSCWGSTSYQRGSPPPDERFLILDAGAGHYCGIRPDRTVGCWGLDDSDQASPPDGVFIEVSSGFRHTCALTEEGKAVCWGDQRDDRIAAPSEPTFAALANGDRHGCGMTARGPIFCWGDDDRGQASPPLPLSCFPSSGHPVDPLEGLTYRGWDGVMARLPPSFDYLGEPDYSGTLTSFEVPPALLEAPGVDFILDMKGLIEFERDEIITFRLRSDDGSEFLLDDHQLIDNDELHSATSVDGPSVCLKKGWHELHVRYFQGRGDAELSLQMSRDGIEFVPAGPFSRLPPTPEGQ